MALLTTRDLGKLDITYLGQPFNSGAANPNILLNSLDFVYMGQPFVRNPTPGLPTVTTTSISSIAQTSAAGGGNVTSDNNSAITARGVCWSTSENPTTADSKTSDGTGSGAFTSSITGLTANTIYYVRAYATNSAGTSYGSEVSFTTDASVVVSKTVQNTIFFGMTF